MMGTQATLTDSASSVAALDPSQPPHNQLQHNGLRNESILQRVELVPCQPAIAEQQQHYSIAAAVTDGSDEATAVAINEKVERGVTAANDGRRSVEYLPIIAAAKPCNAYFNACGLDLRHFVSQTEPRGPTACAQYSREYSRRLDYKAEAPTHQARHPHQ